MELYGGWMTFCPDWLVGSPNLNTANPLHLYVYLLLMNLIWVFVRSCATASHASADRADPCVDHGRLVRGGRPVAEVTRASADAKGGVSLAGGKHVARSIRK
jgi:hypothetical protein